MKKIRITVALLGIIFVLGGCGEADSSGSATKAGSVAFEHQEYAMSDIMENALSEVKESEWKKRIIEEGATWTGTLEDYYFGKYVEIMNDKTLTQEQKESKVQELVNAKDSGELQQEYNNYHQQMEKKPEQLKESFQELGQFYLDCFTISPEEAAEAVWNSFSRDKFVFPHTVNDFKAEMDVCAIRYAVMDAGEIEGVKSLMKYASGESSFDKKSVASILDSDAKNARNKEAFQTFYEAVDKAVDKNSAKYLDEYMETYYDKIVGEIINFVYKNEFTVDGYALELIRAAYDGDETVSDEEISQYILANYNPENKEIAGFSKVTVNLDNIKNIKETTIVPVEDEEAEESIEKMLDKYPANTSYNQYYSTKGSSRDSYLDQMPSIRKGIRLYLGDQAVMYYKQYGENEEQFLVIFRDEQGRTINYMVLLEKKVNMCGGNAAQDFLQYLSDYMKNAMIQNALDGR